MKLMFMISGRQNEREIPSRRFYTADEAIAMMKEFLEPCCVGSDGELSAEELNHDDDW